MISSHTPSLTIPQKIITIGWFTTLNLFEIYKFPNLNVKKKKQKPIGFMQGGPPTSYK